MNYKESALTGKSWQRAGRITIENPVSNGKAIIFHEELATQLSDGTMNNVPLGTLREDFIDPAERFQMRDPVSDGIIEGQTLSYGEAYAILYSLYHHVAGKRDQAEAVKPV